MEQVACSFATKVEFIRSTRLHPQYRIRANSLKTNLLVSAYLAEYPLFGAKFLDFTDWREALQLFEKGLHRSLDGRFRISELKGGMNDSRKVFF